jgi:uracil phosphoribosyltransferase
MQIDRQGKVVIAIPVLLTGGTEIQTLNFLLSQNSVGFDRIRITSERLN